MKHYEVTRHAVDRAVERLGISRPQAAGHIRNLMQTAFYVGDLSNEHGHRTKAFDHIKSRTRLIVDGIRVVTVYKMADPLAPVEDNPTAGTPLITELPDELKTVLKRKSDVLIVRHKRELRSLTIQLAEKNLEIAQLELNRAKARAHKIIAVIDAKIAVARSEYASINEKATAIKSEIESIEKGVAAYV
ncbi:hypothetical protein [Bacillus amyloliquefaciens]|uniref:hypothetical protein n=1 Tax=Bacillus amyloliquefaciens TaxID=1390 RepID=UPI0011C780FC|nr:hypothetical protein [Bacillus amyloliquefaciens]TXK24511.1 hypothetical protein FVD42_11110 [Bacillus amyloliquefaciens]TXK30726.1 hypothetical protein FVD41_11045 [Bacillus amyloliquefaciens]